MKRDLDAIRQILLAVKESDSCVNKIEGMPSDVFNFNTMLLIEADLVLGIAQNNSRKASQAPIHATIQRLTWQGCEFADSIADDGLWNKVKKNVLKPAGSWTFEVLKHYINQEITTKLIG